MDQHGNVFLVGSTYESLGDQTFSLADVFVRKLDESGGESWTRQFGASTSDEGRSVAVDGRGGVVVAGVSGTALEGGPLVSRGCGMYVRKYAPQNRLGSIAGVLFRSFPESCLQPI